MLAVLKNKQATTYHDVINEKGYSYSGRSAEEFKQQGFIVLPEEEAFKIIKKNIEDKYLTAWEEITEDQYWDALETLPPLNFTKTAYGELFWFREFTALDITNVYICIYSNTPRYFKAAKHFTKNHKEILEDLYSHLTRKDN